ncbi:MAG: hypothetical protein R2735_09125 [Microthrixaceae bacterium]
MSGTADDENTLPIKAGSSHRRAMMIVGAVALAPRLAWVLHAAREPRGLHDPLVYLSAARSISEGDGYRSLTGTVTAYFPPGYPFFLGGVHRITTAVGLGDHFFVVVGVLQSLLGVFGAVAVAAVASRLAPLSRSTESHSAAEPKRIEPVALAAGLVLALWPNLIFHTAVLLSETLFIALFLATVWLLISALEASSIQKASPIRVATLLATAGLLFGLSVLTRPQSALVLIPAVLVAGLLARLRLRHSLTAVAVLLAGFCVVSVGWGVRNQMQMGHFVIGSTNTGDNLCIGFNPDSTGRFSFAPACQHPEAYTDGPDSEVRRDRELRDDAIAWALENPSHLPGLSLTKIGLTFFSGDLDGLAASEDYGSDPFFSARTRTVLEWSANIYYFAVMGLSLAGLTMIWARRRAVLEVGDGRAGVDAGSDVDRSKVAVAVASLCVLVVTFGALVPALSFGDQRFKVPLMPFVAVIAGFGLAAGWQQMTRAVRAPRRMNKSS